MSKPKIVYIAHPVSGDVSGNLEKISKIVRNILMGNETSNVLPFAPYFLTCHALDDSKPMEREIGIEINTEYFMSGIIDEVWLYGDKISSGMRAEIEIAHSLEIPVTAVSMELDDEYKSILAENEEVIDAEKFYSLSDEECRLVINALSNLADRKLGFVYKHPAHPDNKGLELIKTNAKKLIDVKDKIEKQSKK